MDILRLLGVAITEYPIYLFSSTYDPTRFWNKCIRINVLYTKLLQAYAVKYISDKYQYRFNDIPWTPSEIPDIEHITTTKIIGSGMISIVMEGTDKNGNLCVVKAKRKDIHEKIVHGLKEIKNIFGWLMYIPFMKNIFNLNYMYNAFEISTLEQLSFENEIKNHKKFKEIVAHDQHIKVPELYEEYCTNNQIVMSKINGQHLYNMTQEEGHRFSTYLSQMCTKNIILDGFIHTDLHAGNIIFTDDQCIGIIDFGLMYQIPPQIKQSLFDLFKHFIRKEYSNASSIIYNDFICPDEIKRTLSIGQVQEIKALIITVYTNAYEINHCLSQKDFYTVIHALIKYNLHFNQIFYNFMMFVISSELLVNKISQSPMNIFMETMATLYSDVNTDE
jgi:predicted unusual protein kinase regulating ubiquinone biosynthesis (AarF/ABC1/UbiB family)